MTFSEMSIAGAVMIIVIAVVRALTVNKLPKRTFVILWEIVLLRLLLPFSIPSVTSVYNFFDKPAESETVQVETVEADYPEAAYVPDDFYGNIEHYTPVYAPPAEDSYVPEYEPVDRKKPVPVLKIVWLSGAAVFALLFVSLYAVALSRFRFAEMIGEGLPVEILGGQHIKRKVKICVSSRVKTPLTYGIIRPVILLPKGLELTNRELMTYIITHECTHIKKFDMCRKIIAAAAVCAHWFNPAVWAMYLLFNRDIELACDEAVVKATGLECRGVYANVLIGMETSRGFASLYSNFSKNAVEERITAIMKTKKLTKITAAVACAVVLAVAGVFVTSAVKKADIEASSETSDNALSADKTVYYGKTKSVIKSVLDEEGYLWPIAFAFADLNLDGTDELFLYTSSGPVGRPQEGYIRVYDISGEPVLLGKIKGNVHDYFGTAAPDEPCFGKLYSGADGSMHFIVDTYYENESWNGFRAYYDITYGEKFSAEIPLYGRVESQYNGGAHLLSYELYSGCGSDLSAGYDYEKNHGFVTDNAEYLGRCDMFKDEISGYAEKYVYGGLNYVGDVSGVYRKTVVAADGYDVTGYGKAQSFEEYWRSVTADAAVAETEAETTAAETVIIAGQEFSVDETAVSILITDESDPVTDISELSKLEKLKSIYVNYITDGGFHRKIDGLKALEGSETIEEIDIKTGLADDEDIHILETMPNLKSLSLYGGYEDFEFNLPSLKYLYLNGTYDLSKIEHLTGLEHLHLEFNNGYDLSPIAKLKNLKGLKIVSCYFEDYSSILELNDLEGLWISSRPMTKEMYNKICEKFPDCKITVVNDFIKEAETVTIAGKEYPPETESISLGRERFDNADIRSLSRLGDLKYLYIDLYSDKCGADDLSPLAELKGLERLDINGGIFINNDIGFIEEMTGLRVLYLNHFGEIKLPHSSVEKLVIGESSADDLDTLSNLNALRELSLSHFSCKDYSGIGKVGTLRILGMNMLDEYDADLSFLSGLKSLTKFEYTMPCGTLNFGSISDCKELESLYVFADIDDLNFCRSLKKLKEFTFYAESEKLYDLLPLESCTELKKLELYCEYSNIYAVRKALPDCKITGGTETVTIAGQEFSVDAREIKIKFDARDVDFDRIDLSEIGKFTKLKKLSILNNVDVYHPIELINCEGLAQLENLEEITLRSVKYGLQRACGDKKTACA